MTRQPLEAGARLLAMQDEQGELSSRQKLNNKLERNKTVLELHRQGVSGRQIAKRLNIGEVTVRRVLRACLQSYEAFKAKVCGEEVDQGFGGLGVVLVVFGQTAVPVEPAEGSFNDPAFRQDFEFVEFWAFDDFQSI